MEIRNLDPFLLLDEFSVSKPAGNAAGRQQPPSSVFAPSQTCPDVTSPAAVVLLYTVLVRVCSSTPGCAFALLPRVRLRLCRALLCCSPRSATAPDFTSSPEADHLSS